MTKYERARAYRAIPDNIKAVDDDNNSLTLSCIHNLDEVTIKRIFTRLNNVCEMQQKLIMHLKSELEKTNKKLEEVAEAAFASDQD